MSRGTQDRVSKPPAEASLPALQSTGDGWRRLGALLILTGCAAVLGISAWLKPAPRGFGTHRQLGFGPCGILVMTGYPCPTCGMTTSFAHFVRGQWVQSILRQPGAFVLALGTVGASIVAGIVLVRGRVPDRWRPWLDWYYVFWAVLISVLGGWALRLIMGLCTGELPMRSG